MKPNDTPWERLAAVARKAPESPAEIPHGFATRIAARAFEKAPSPTELLSAVAFRALGFAAVIAITCTVINYSTLTSESLVSDNSEYDPAASIIEEL